LVRQFDRFQQRHTVVAFPVAVVQKFGNDQVGGQAVIIAYCGLFALFPLLLLFTTILGFALSGDSGFQRRVFNSALANFPIIGSSCAAPGGAQRHAHGVEHPLRTLAEFLDAP
jgi:uncharacterized BrkB/YihY/UPF0761 family membrane protein